MSIDPNAPFHPSATWIGDRGTSTGGLTIRAWFTGMALEGLLSDHDQMRAFEESAVKAAKIIVEEHRAGGREVDKEETTREALDTLIAFRSVEIADMVIARLNATEAELPTPEQLKPLEPVP